MTLFSRVDLIALFWFLGAWIGYAVVIELSPRGNRGLNGLMHRYRGLWMQRMLARDARMIDGQVIAGLQNGSAFFASTSLLALGGALTLFHSSEDMLTVIAALPFGEPVTHVQWELKVVGLMIIFVYAFFKFAWAYRLYNYVAIMVGAAPPAAERDEPDAKAHARGYRRNHHRCRPALQSRSARILFCARLSRLVFRPVAAHRHDGRRFGRHLAPAIRFGIVSGRARRLNSKPTQTMPVTTARNDTNRTAAAVNMTVSAVSTHSLVAGVASASAAGSAMAGRSAADMSVDVISVEVMAALPQRTKRNDQVSDRSDEGLVKVLLRLRPGRMIPARRPGE